MENNVIILDESSFLVDFYIKGELGDVHILPYNAICT